MVLGLVQDNQDILLIQTIKMIVHNLVQMELILILELLAAVLVVNPIIS